MITALTEFGLLIVFSAAFEFYHRTIPSLSRQLEANKAHSTIVRKLAEINPDILFVDTHPNLDGLDDKFIDAIHFAPEGEEQMAETMFAGIKNTLERDLGKTNRVRVDH